MSQDSREIEPTGGKTSLLDLALLLTRQKRVILGIPALAVLAAILITWIMTPQFTAVTRILAPEKTQGTAALAAQLGGAIGLAAGSVGIKNPNDMYIGMMRSRSVGVRLLERFDLMKRWNLDVQSLALKRLESTTSIIAGKDSIIAISFTDESPRQAADIANAYVDELRALTRRMAVTEAGRRRLFFEQQLETARKNLATAEAAAKQGIETSGLAKVDDQGRTLVEIGARLRGQIAAKEIQIGSMRYFAADSNPDLSRAQQELAMLKRQLAQTEGDSPRHDERPETHIRAGSNVNLLRDLKYYETIYEFLARELELARIDEAKDSAIIQVIDPAVPPDRKSKPARAIIVLTTAFVALLLALAIALVRERLGEIESSPDGRDKLARLRANLR